MQLIIRCIGGRQSGREWKFDGQGTLTLGRDSRNAIQALPEEHGISRRHCEIKVVPPEVYVADAGSTYGTYVDGRCIGNAKYPVRSGSVLGVGPNGREAEYQIIIENTGRDGAAGQRRYAGYERPQAARDQDYDEYAYRGRGYENYYRQNVTPNPGEPVKHTVPKCSCCGYVGRWKVEPLFLTRHWIIGLFFLILGIFPGIIYLTAVGIIRSGEGQRGKICENCGARNLFTFFY